MEVNQRHLEVDCARQLQLDCANRQLDRDRNSNLSPNFDSKPKVQTRSAWSGGMLSSGSRGLDYVKTEFSLGALDIHSGANPGPHRLERHPGQHCSPLVQAVFKDCQQAMRCGQICDTLYEEVELAGTSSLVEAKGGEKGSDFSPPTTDTTTPFHSTIRCSVVDYI